MDIKKVLMYVVIVILVYLLYKWLFRDPTSSNLLDSGDGTQQKIVKAKDIKGNKDSTYFTYSMWIYVSSWDTTKEKVILRRGNGDNSCPKM